MLPLELSFELSIGEVILIVAVIAIATLLLSIKRAQETSEAKMSHAQAVSSYKECPARFGFLKKLPRGSRIPEECFVCNRLIECLGFEHSYE